MPPEVLEVAKRYAPDANMLDLVAGHERKSAILHHVRVDPATQAIPMVVMFNSQEPPTDLAIKLLDELPGETLGTGFLLNYRLHPSMIPQVTIGGYHACQVFERKHPLLQ
ncbi:MAG: hypothetical protein M1358_09015 [Chloroflexi bacterium]|nr:hypothetical protein [Chloroflexota bacterium]